MNPLAVRCCAVAAAAFVLASASFSAGAEEKSFRVQAQDAASSLMEFGRQSGLQIIFGYESIRGIKTNAIDGIYEPLAAIRVMLKDTGLSVTQQDNGILVIEPNNDNASSQAAPRTLANPAGMRLAESKTAEAGGRTTETAGAAESTDSEAARGSAKVEEIIVTATKRAENVQDVPISIAVVSADDIDQRRLVGAADYLRGMPGVNQTELGYGGQAIIIRGLETTNSFLNFSGGTTVGTYFGETPTTNSAGLLGSSVDLKLVDVERVEVLRGPQGTAFGSSSMGGTVRVIPAAPQLDTVSGKLAAGYSATAGTGGDNYTFQGSGNLPLVEGRVALRAVAYRFADSGFYRNAAGSNATFQSQFVVPYGVQGFATDEDEIGATTTTGARLSLLLQASDDLRFTLSYLTQESETDGYPNATSGTYEQTLTRVAPEHVFRGQTGGINDNEVDIANAVVEYDFGWADLVASYSLIEGRSDHALVATLFALPWPVSFHQFSPHEEYSGEIRLATKLEGPWNFLAGLYADEQDDEYQVDWIWYGDPATNFFVPRERDLLDYVDRRELKQKAAFAEVSWDFAPRWTLTGGVRAYDYERRTRIAQNGPLLAGTSVLTDDSTDDSGTTLRANLSYKPTEDSLLYAAWAQGFRLGRPQPPLPGGACDVNGDGLIDGTNVSIGSTGSVSSDNVDSYELGGKFALLDRRVTLDAALFRMDWTNIPVQILPPCGYAYTTNAGVGRSQGLELQANLQVTDRFLVSLGASWIDAELTQDVPAQGFSAGDRLPGTPKESANLGLQYSFQLAGHAAYVRADSIYVGRFFGDIPQSTHQLAGDYMKVNASGRVQLGKVDLDVYIQNLTDEDAFTSRGNGLDQFYGYRLRPRTIGFQLGYHF